MENKHASNSSCRCYVDFKISKASFVWPSDLEKVKNITFRKLVNRYFMTLIKKQKTKIPTFRPTLKNVGRSTSNKNIFNDSLILHVHLFHIIQPLSDTVPYRSANAGTGRRQGSDIGGD